MLTLKAPIQLHTGQALTTSCEAFGERIMGNYHILNTKITPKDLLLLLTAPPEVLEEQGGMTTLVNHDTRVDLSNVTVDVVNNVVNRILLDGSSSFTYQDQVYITSVLNRLGITDVAQFMTQVRQLRIETENTNYLTRLYRSELERVLRHDTESETRVLLPAAVRQTEENDTALDPRTELSIQILNRLGTSKIYETIHKFQKSVAQAENHIQHNELRLSEHLRFGNEVSLAQIKQQLFEQPEINLTHHVNHYETGTILEVPQSEEQVLSQAAVAALVSAVDNTVTEVINRPQIRQEQWMRLEQSIWQTATNAVSRFESYHNYYESPPVAAVLNVETAWNRYVDEMRQYLTLRQYQDNRINQSYTKNVLRTGDTALTHLTQVDEENEFLFQKKTDIRIDRDRLRTSIQKLLETRMTGKSEDLPPSPGQELVHHREESVLTEEHTEELQRVVQEIWNRRYTEEREIAPRPGVPRDIPSIPWVMRPSESEQSAETVWNRYTSERQQHLTLQQNQNNQFEQATTRNIHSAGDLNLTHLTQVDEENEFLFPEKTNVQIHQDRLRTTVENLVETQITEQLGGEVRAPRQDLVHHRDETVHSEEHVEELRRVVQEIRNSSYTEERVIVPQPGVTQENQKTPDAALPAEVWRGAEMVWNRYLAEMRQYLTLRQYQDNRIDQAVSKKIFSIGDANLIHLTQVEEDNEFFSSEKTNIQTSREGMRTIIRELMETQVTGRRELGSPLQEREILRQLGAVRTEERTRELQRELLEIREGRRAEERRETMVPVVPQQYQTMPEPSLPPVELTAREAEEQAPEILMEQLHQIDQHNRTILQQLQNAVQLQKMQPPKIPQPDFARTMRDGLRALEQPEMVLREIYEEGERQRAQKSPYTAQEEAILRQASPVDRALYERVLAYQKDPETALRQGMIRPTNPGALEAQIRQLEAQTPQVLEHRAPEQETQEIFEETENVLQKILHHTMRGTQVVEQHTAPGAVRIVHKQSAPDISEELMERLEQKNNREVIKTENNESITRHNTSRTEITNEEHKVVQKTTEDITELVNRTLAKQMRTISDQVYRQMEKRLQTERSRRGRF